MDERHFRNYRHHQTFNLPQEVGPFQLNRLGELQKLDSYLINLNMMKREAFQYYPQGIISNIKIDKNNSTYESNPIPE